MRKQLLTMALIGSAVFGVAQQGKKPAKEFKSPPLIQVRDQTVQQDGKALVRKKLELKQSDDLKPVSIKTDKLGFKHEKFQHYYKGVKVFGSQYSVHYNNGQVSHLSGNYAKVEDLDVNPKVSENEALIAAKSRIEAKKFIWEEDASKKPEGELMILDAATTGNEARLVYKFEVIALKPYQRYDVYIDAKTGEEVMKYSKIHFADAVGTAATRYSGSQSVHTDSYSGSFRLRDYSRGNGVVTWDGSTATGVNNSTGVPIGSSDFTDNDNNWTYSEFHNSGKDDAGLEAHFAAAATYDFFYQTFGRDSYNGSGATINGHINTDIEGIYGYPSGYNDNAFWNGYVMVYGKGNSLDPLTTVDITGHEIGHAFMEYTAGMVYQKESGAMNESFSDIWGTCVENYTNVNYGTSKDLWNLGTEIGSTFRSMSNPNAHGQPDTYGGSYWVSVTNCNPTGSNDYCGVHTNSGVGNHWFYILTVGKSGTNDIGNSYSVSGIGIDKAAAISWRSQSVYLGANSTYANWRTYSIQSAKDLYGEGSAEEIAVTNAWHAVGVGAAYAEPVGCVTAPLALSITFDNYPEETSWTIKNSSGATVQSGGTYGSQADGSTVNLNVSLAAGDYTFTINDAYGDGICCSYGNGSYTLASGSTTIVSGGSFGSSEATAFCIEGGAADTQAPTAPTGLSASSVSQTSLTLSWNASTDNVAVTGYEVFRNGNSIGSVTGTSANVSGLAASTTYSFTVKAKDEAGNISDASSVLSVTTSGTSVSYCSASGSNASYEWIDLVRLGSIDNSTGANGGYGDYTGQSTSLAVGSSNSVSFSAGFSGSAYRENWRIWIDYNKDGDFNDSGEQVVSGSTTRSSTYSATFTVPGSASLGATRMRVAMAYDTTPSTCGSFGYGEVEDYTVNITSASVGMIANIAGNMESGERLEAEAVMAFEVYPNPVSNILKFSLGNVKEVKEVRVLDLAGKQVLHTRNAPERSVDISSLKTGMYIFEVLSERGWMETKFLKQ